MNNEMIERVANAIHDQGLDDSYEGMSVRDSIKLASAAIEAMRLQLQAHYWDSVQIYKPIIMHHINKVLDVNDS